MATQAEKEDFFGCFFKAFKEQRCVDVKVMAEYGKEAIPAHKFVLAAGSEVFRGMFEKDEFKRSVDSVITIDLLDQEGLEAFLEFMYRGTLPHEKLRTHIRKLYGVAIAYEFPHLHDFCGNFLTSSLASYNALAIAELASICKDKVLKDAAFRFVIENADVIPSHLFKEFFERNSGLAVDLIKEFREEIKVFSFCNSMFEKFFNSFK